MPKISKAELLETRLFELIENGSARQLLAFFKESPDISDASLLRGVHRAVSGGNSTLVEILMAAGADFRRGESQYVQSIFVAAIVSGCLRNVDILLEEGISLSLQHQEICGPTPIQAAIQTDNTEMLERLITAGCTLTCKDINGYTALHTVTKSHFAQRLISAGAPVDCSGGTQRYTPLHLAIEENRINVAKVLLDNKAKVDAWEQRSGYIPLHIAIITGNVKALSLLLQYKPGKQINYLTQKANKSALHLVVTGRQRQRELLLSLVGAGARLDVQDFERNTPLMIALKQTDLEMASLIIDSTPKDQVIKSFLSIDTNGNTVLHIMGQMQQCPHIAVLADKVLQRLPDPSLLEKVNMSGLTALTVATKCGHTELVRYFLKLGVNVNARSVYGTALHVAITLGHDSIAKMLVNVEDFQFSILDRFGETVLHKAALVANCAMIEHILEKGIPSDLVSVKGSRGRTALHYLLKRSSEDVHHQVLRSLAEHGANMDATDAEGDSPLILAAKSDVQNARNMTELVEMGASVNMSNKQGKTALHYVCSSHRTSDVKLLVENGALCDLQDESGDTPLHVAAASGHEDIMHYLLSSNEHFHYNLNIVGKENKTILYYAAKLGMHAVVSLLLSQGAQPDVKKSVPSPLILAAQSGFVEMVRDLLEHEAQVDAQDNHGQTALMVSAAHGHISCMRLLLSYQANAAMMDNTGDTSLTKAAWAGYMEAVEILIPVTPNLMHTEGEEGMSALHLAIAREHSDCVRLLLNSGADVNIVDNHDNTALLTAAMLTSGSKILQMVLECGQQYNINAVGDKGRTALHWAVGEPESVLLLLKYKPELNVLDKFKASPLLLAIAHKQPESARLLIEAGCSVDMVHNDGRKPIHHAAIYGDVLTTRLLIERSVDPDSPMKDGRRPLVLAAIENHAEVIQTLLQHNVSFDRVYFDAFTALSTTVSNHHMESMQILLSHGANPDLIGAEKHRPLVQAILVNFSDGIVPLVQAGAQMDIDTNAEHHPLYVAIMKNTKVIPLLLQIGCNPNCLQQIVSKKLLEYFVDDEELSHQIKHLARQPCSLSQLCRTILRQNIKLPLAINVDNTCLPQSLKDFLVYSELN